MSPLVGFVLTSIAVTSLVTAMLFGWDKYRAKSGGRRVPEAVLLTWAFFGGWPGALAARRLFRHKTTKQPFVAYLWCIVGLHGVGCALAIVWFVRS